MPSYALGGGRQGTGVRPLSQAPASAASQTSRRGAVPAPCTQTLENYSPSLKGARYPSSMGDRLQRPFAGCDTGKPAPGAPALTVLPPIAPPDAGKGTDWVFLGFGMAGGSRGRPPMAAEPDPVQPLRRRSPHGEVGPTVAVAPPHSGVTDFDFGPGGGLGSEGLDFGYDGVPDPVAAEIRDRHGAYPGLLPGDVPDPDLETRQPAGALDARDLHSSSVRLPLPRKAVGPALFAGAIGPGQLPGMTMALGPDSASRDLSLLTRATQRSLGGGGGGGARAVGRAGSIAEAGAEADQRFREANNAFITGAPGAWERLQGADQDYKRAREAYRKLQRERNIGVSFEDAVRRAEEQAAVDDKIQRNAAVLEHRAGELTTRAWWKRFDARERRFDALSGSDLGAWRALDYERARDALQRARGEFRDLIRDARRTLQDLRGKEDRSATAARTADLRAAASRADAEVEGARAAYRAAEAALAGATPGTADALWAIAAQREQEWADAVRHRERVESLQSLGSFRNLVKATEGAVAHAEGARREYESAAERLKDLTLGSSTEDERAQANANLADKERALNEAIAEMVAYLMMLHEATQPQEERKPGEKRGRRTEEGPDVPAWACKGDPTCDKPPCPRADHDEVCVECWWEKSGGFVSVGGGKGKAMGSQVASLGGPRRADESAIQRMADQAPMANIHQLDGRGVKVPGDGPAGGVGAEPAMSTYASAHGPIPYRRSPDDNWTKPPQPPPPGKAPADSSASIDTDLALLRARVDSWRVDRVNAMVRVFREQEQGPRRAMHPPRHDLVSLAEVGLSQRAFDRLVTEARRDEARGRHPRSPLYDPLGRAPERSVLETLAAADFERAEPVQEGLTYGGIASDVVGQGFGAAGRAGEGIYSGAVGVGGVGLSLLSGGPFTEAGRRAFEQSARAFGAAEEAFAGRAEAERLSGMLSEPGALATGEGHVTEFAREAAGGRLLEIESPQDEGSVLRAVGQTAAVVGPVAIDVATPAEGLVRPLRVLHALKLKQAGRLVEFEAIRAAMKADELRQLQLAAEVVEGGGGSLGGRATVMPEATVAGVGDEVQAGAKGASADATPKPAGADDSPLAPQDTIATPPDGPVPKGEPKAEPEPLKPEGQDAGKGDGCECKPEPRAPENSGSATGVDASAARKPGGSESASTPKGGVYVLRDPVTGEVVRVGRTNNFARRAAEHARDPALRGYDFDEVHYTDNRAQQRGLEQVLHDKYNPPLDKINPINPSNPRRQQYLDAAQEFLSGGGP